MYKKDLFCPQMASGSNSERKLWTGFEFADFFLVRSASLFTLRTFGAQINWRVISRKVLFDPQHFLSNKSPIQFAGESGKENMFLNGKQHVQNENGHRSPRSQTYMPNSCKNLNPPNFSLPSTFKGTVSWDWELCELAVTSEQDRNGSLKKKLPDTYLAWLPTL